jgi:hypothetical protein
MYLLGNNPRTSVATELDPHSMHCQKMMLSLVLYSIVIIDYHETKQELGMTIITYHN